MTHAPHRFVPALSFDALTPLYDTLIQLTMRERAFKQRLIERAHLGSGQRVLDLGCGTGTLALLLREQVPSAEVVGLDIDPRILAIARNKAAAAGARMTFVEGSVTQPPFADGEFDRIVTSLVVHHLTLDEKRQMFAAARRMLRPGGEFHIADFGPPHNLYTRFVSLPFRYFDGEERTRPNLEGRLPELLREAGFMEVVANESWTTAFGTLVFLRARHR